LPSSVEAKPHCHDRHPLGIDELVASSMRRLSAPLDLIQREFCDRQLIRIGLPLRPRNIR
jgi:hypothetical protein